MTRFPRVTSLFKSVQESAKSFVRVRTGPIQPGHTGVRLEFSRCWRSSCCCLSAAAASAPAAADPATAHAESFVAGFIRARVHTYARLQPNRAWNSRTAHALAHARDVDNNNNILSIQTERAMSCIHDRSIIKSLTHDPREQTSHERRKHIYRV